MTNKFSYVKTRREDVREITPRAERMVSPIIKYATKLNVWVFKKSRGRLMKTFFGGAPICVVTMTGAKSGKSREVALIHIPWGDKKILVASKGGMSRHPVWFYNVKANPEVEILVGGESKSYLAEQVSAEQKAEIWPRLLEVYPDFDEYQARTDRDIPVFVCTPRACSH